MKEGRTHLGHKAEHAVDLDTGAVLGVTLQPADLGDTQSLGATVEATMEGLDEILEDEEAAAPTRPSPTSWRTRSTTATRC